MHAEFVESVPHHGGWVAPGFEEVRDEFERNFAERGEIGAAVAAYWRGEKVVDLWGGRRTPERRRPWNEDTMVLVISTTKGLAAMTVAVANSRGWIDYDAPVAEYWPEFAQNGKGAITVRQLLGHEAGLVWIDEPLQLEDLRDLDRVARVLARQKPAWEPGTRHGYHAMTIGLYMQELIRHVDPAHRTLGRFFARGDRGASADRVLHRPSARDPRRAARAAEDLHSRWRHPSAAFGPQGVRDADPVAVVAAAQVAALRGLDPNDRRWLDIEVPAGNGVGTARAIARAYSAFAEGGAELGITPATLASLTAIHDPERPRDEIMGVPSWLSLGFLRRDRSSIGARAGAPSARPGAGGSFGFADPDARLGFAYVMNNMDFHMFDDPREKALRDAVHRSIARLSA